jgi:hypothetical protein
LSIRSPSIAPAARRAILTATGNTTLAAYFLLHDAHEHTLKDDTTPKKRAIAELASERFGILGEHIFETFKLLGIPPGRRDPSRCRPRMAARAP